MQDYELHIYILVNIKIIKLRYIWMKFVMSEPFIQEELMKNAINHVKCDVWR
jgi:hypothetical protein